MSGDKGRPCPHENIGTELVMQDGKVVSASTKCDDCGKRLT